MQISLRTDRSQITSVRNPTPSHPNTLLLMSVCV